MLHHAVSNDIAGPDHVLLARLETDLVNEALAREGKETAAGDKSATPVC